MIEVKEEVYKSHDVVIEDVKMDTALQAEKVNRQFHAANQLILDLQERVTKLEKLVRFLNQYKQEV